MSDFLITPGTFGTPFIQAAADAPSAAIAACAAQPSILAPRMRRFTVNETEVSGTYQAFCVDNPPPLGGNPRGQQFVVAAEGVPAVTALAPSTGSHLGNTAVTVTGTGFLDATGVTFGATAATSVVVVSDTQITCVAPAHAAATVDVHVTNPAGTSPSNPPGDQFVYT